MNAFEHARAAAALLAYPDPGSVRTNAQIASSPVWVMRPRIPAVDQSWRDSAACRGMSADLFHPLRGENSDIAEAKAVCNVCAVRQQCLDYALDAGELVGVWGGTSGDERRRMRRDARKIA